MTKTQTKTNVDLAWHIQSAEYSLTTLVENLKADIRQNIYWIRKNIDEVERELTVGKTPNTCGILQNCAYELEMALARFSAIRDAQAVIAILADAVDSMTK